MQAPGFTLVFVISGPRRVFSITAGNDTAPSVGCERPHTSSGKLVMCICERERYAQFTLQNVLLLYTPTSVYNATNSTIQFDTSKHDWGLIRGIIKSAGVQTMMVSKH